MQHGDARFPCRGESSGRRSPHRCGWQVCAHSKVVDPERKLEEKASIQDASPSSIGQESLTCKQAPTSCCFSASFFSGPAAVASAEAAHADVSPERQRAPTSPANAHISVGPTQQSDRMSTAEELAEMLPSEPPTPSHHGGSLKPSAVPCRSSWLSGVSPVSDTSSSSHNGGNRTDPSSSGEHTRGNMPKTHPTALSEQLLHRDSAGRPSGAADRFPSSCSSFSSPPPTPMPLGDGGPDGPQQQQLGSEEQQPPLFREEYSHMAPAAYDSVDEDEVLRKAEKIIVQQRNRLEQLSSLLLRSENEKVAAHRATQEQIGRYVEENRKLRLHLDSMNGEVGAMNSVNCRNEKMIEHLTLSLAAAEKGISERDRLLAIAQSRDRAVENEQLKEEIQRLKCNLEEVTKRNASLGGGFDGGAAGGDGAAGPRSADDVADQLARVQREIDRHRSMGRQLGHTIQELRVSKMSVMQSQSDLLEAQKLVEEQRIEIQRLYKVIDALNREKSLVPPVVLAPPHALVVRKTQQQLEHLSEQVRELLRKNHAPPPEDDGEGARISRGLGAGQQGFVEQQKLLARVVEALEQLAAKQAVDPLAARRWDLEKDVFFAGLVLHAQTEEPQEHPPFREKLVAVKAATLAVFDEPTDEEPVVILRAHKVVTVRQSHEEFSFEIEYEIHPETVEYHYIKCEDEEEYDKWLYALMYAGIVKRSVQVAPVQVAGRLEEEPSPVSPDAITFVSSTGKSPTGKRIPYALEGALLNYDADENALICQPPPGKPEAQLWLPCSKISMKTDFENFAFHFNVEEGEPGTYTIQATPENFDRIADVVHRGRYYHSPYVRQATPPSPPPEKKDPQRKPKKKAPLPPPKKQPSPTEDQEDDLFVVRDGYLMLFQNPGDRDPILKLFHADCITNPDPTAREFVIRHMPGTPDEETYVFGFMTDEIYEGWYKKLKANGFLDRKEDSGNIKANQVGVVSKNTLELYRYYGTPGAKPVLQMHADRCSATASRERREIRIIHTTPAGKRERITLDCATVAEFDRWNVALEFGGFLKAQEGDAGNQPRYANLNKYVFPVNLFEEDTGNRRTALSIKGGAICFYPSPDAAEPIMKILAQDSQVQYFIAQRKIRVYVNRNTDAEERVDFILALAKDYDRYSAECAKQHFPDADAKPKGTSTKPFVLCKKNLMAVYKNKHQKTPEIVIERASYEVASFPGRVLVFRPNNDLPKAKLFSCPERTVTIPDDEQMRKWSFCLKLVGFRSFCDTPPPRFFFPQVIYGFIAEEASELRTDLGRGNLIGGLFGVSPLKGSLQKPKDQELASPASSFAPAAQED